MTHLKIQNVDNVTVKFYKRDMKLCYGLKSKPKGGRGKGQAIKEYTTNSMKRLAFVANNTQIKLSIMITLTYPDEWPCDGKIIKAHLNKFLNSLRRKGIEYLWFLEFQNRGAPHLHLLIDQFIEHDYVAKRWFKIVDSKQEKHLKAGTRVEKLRTIDGGARYATKYAYKLKQKIVPEKFQNVGRFWGHSKSVEPVAVAVHVDATVAEVLDYSEGNTAAKNRIGLWAVGHENASPLSVVFGCGNNYSGLSSD